MITKYSNQSLKYFLNSILPIEKSKKPCGIPIIDTRKNKRYICTFKLLSELIKKYDTNAIELKKTNNFFVYHQFYLPFFPPNPNVNFRNSIFGK